MGRRMLREARREDGMSLIEIMITLALGLLIVGGILYTFISSRTVLSSNDAMARIQEDGRIAMERLTREVRQGGFVGCSNALDVVTRVSADPDGDGNTAEHADFTGANAVEAFDDGIGWVNPTTIPRVAGTDVIQLKGLSTCTARLTGNMAADNANIQIGTNSCGWAAGRILVIADCTHVDIFAATNVSAGVVTIAHSAAANTDSKLSKAYGREATIFGYAEKTFFVGIPQALGPPVLYELSYDGTTTTTNDIVGNVYDLQILSVTADTDGNGAPDLTVGSTGSPPALGAVADWAQVLALQLRVSVRSEADHVGPSNTAYDYNGAQISDRRIRRDFLTTIGIRNRLP